MRVILLQDIKALGKRGDVKNVADGYARNFLLPRNLVKPATSAAIQIVETQKAKVDEQLRELKAELESIRQVTTVEPLIFQVKTGEQGEVFSSVGAEEIKKKLVEKFPKIQSADLEVQADHIKELGKSEIGIKLDRGLEGRVTIEVQPQQS